MIRPGCRSSLPGTFCVAEDLLTNVWLHQQVMLKLADGRMLDGLRV
jgi:hypothetical protein